MPEQTGEMKAIMVEYGLWRDRSSAVERGSSRDVLPVHRLAAHQRRLPVHAQRLSGHRLLRHGRPLRPCHSPPRVCGRFFR